MGIITISRELAALGDETAKELAKQMSYRFIDKYTIEERIKAMDTNHAFLKKYDERKPSLFAFISEDREDFRHHLTQAVLLEASEGDCIFVGRGVFAVLERLPGILPVFLVSSLKVRIERVKSYFGCDDKRARQILGQSDQDRAGFHKLFFEKEWKAPENYVLTLNTSVLHPVVCADIIKNTAGQIFSAEQTSDCAARLRDMKRAQDVIRHIRYERHIDVHFLDAVVSDNSVQLLGVANSSLMVEAAVLAAQELPGIQQVNSEIQVIQEYPPSPYKI